MMNMKLLVVVTPTSIYHKALTQITNKRPNREKVEDQEKLLQEVLHTRQERKPLMSGNQKVTQSQYPTVSYLYHSRQRDRKSMKY